MQLIANGTQGGTSPPAKLAATGTPGFANNVVGGTPTVADPDVFNTVLQELQNVVTGAGLALDPTNNGQVAAAIKLLPSGRLLNVQTFAASGTYTPTPGTNKIIVQAVGGGASGSGLAAIASGQYGVSGGGGAGAYVEAEFLTGFMGGVTVTIGAGGAPVASNSGSAGTTTSFGTLITAAGAPAANFQNSNVSASLPIGGAGNTGGTTFSVSGGVVLISGNGGAGTWGWNILGDALGGAGGASAFGAGAPPPGSLSTPNSGVSPGSGGSGICSASGSASAARPGGAGANGLVIVSEYS